MDKYRVIITPIAGDEIEAIYGWIAKDSPANAAKMVSRILDALEPLKTFPHRTIVDVQHPDLKYPVRSLPVRPYIVLFRVLEDERVVRVLHIRHGAQQFPANI